MTISPEILAPPPSESPYRRLYENSLERDDEMLGLGASVYHEVATSANLLTGYESVEELVERFEEAQEPLDDLLTAVLDYATTTGIGTHNELFRLKTLQQLLPHAVLLPHLLRHPRDDHEASEIRQGLTDGLYGDIGELLREAYQARSKARQEVPRKELAGVVNELTPLALLNRVQSVTFSALPGSLRHDLVEQTDIVAFMYPTRNAQFAMSQNIQVKTQRGNTDGYRRDIMLLFADEFNREPYLATRYILRELEGKANNTEQTYLDKTAAALVKKVRTNAQRNRARENTAHIALSAAKT
jgi:hypothetical protein